jgi:hypothetical protein
MCVDDGGGLICKKKALRWTKKKHTLYTER